MFDKIRPDPSLRRSTTAAAVSSQVVSIPSTSIGVSLLNLSPCVIGETGAFRSRAKAFSGEVATGSRAANASKMIKTRSVLIYPGLIWL
ncbi:MAG: hypothetical protein P4M05_04700 [Bradyrhizobium sp.]|nr:hypothetical protein [Bradyrhizobium sp.]